MTWPPGLWAVVLPSAGRCPTAAAAASRTAPERTRSTTASISGARWRSGPGTFDAAAADGVAHRAGGRGEGGSGVAQVQRPRRGERLDREHRVSPSTDRRSLRAAAQPIDTWSSCIAEDGIESTLAGTASRLSSQTIPAAVYWAIMWPESTPGSCGEERRQAVAARASRNRSVRRSLMLARSAVAIARKSSTYADAARRGSCRSTRPARRRSRPGCRSPPRARGRRRSRRGRRVSRAAPCTWGAHRSE